jgi:hypothetical protein
MSRSEPLRAAPAPIRASLASVTSDRRLQALLIAFCFGAFIEGAAGFGTPVAIAGATLAGLGFRPFYAAGICLIANTAPVAFGAIGTAVVALGGVMGLNDAGLMKLSTMVGHQLPFVSLIIPAYIVLIMVGFTRSMEVLPAIVVCSVTFAACQWATASFLGPYLPDIIASLASMAALVLLLRVWRPRTTYRFDHEPPLERETHDYTTAQVARAWTPYFALTFVVLLWGLPPVKAALNRGTLVIPVAGLDNAIARMPAPLPGAADPAAQPAPPGNAAAPVAVPAKFRLDYLASGGSAVFIAAFFSAIACGLGAGDTLRVLGKTLYDMRFPMVTIAAVLALAYVMNASGSPGRARVQRGGRHRAGPHRVARGARAHRRGRPVRHPRGRRRIDRRDAGAPRGPRLAGAPNVHRHSNRGHGQSCLAGYIEAERMGAAAFFQIDSDGQCDPAGFAACGQGGRRPRRSTAGRTTRDDGAARRVISKIRPALAEGGAPHAAERHQRAVQAL